MKVSNKVVEGYLKGAVVTASFGKIRLVKSFSNRRILTKEDIVSYEVEEVIDIEKANFKKVFKGAFIGGLVADTTGALLGSILSARDKQTKTILLYMQFTDGEEVIIDVSRTMLANIVRVINKK